LYLFSFSIAISTPKVLSSDTSGSAVCTSNYLTLWTQCTLNNRIIMPAPIQNTVGVCKQITLLIIYCTSFRYQPDCPYTGLWYIYYYCLLFLHWFYLWDILSLFLKFLLASCLTLFRLSMLPWFGSCIYFLLTCLFWCKNYEFSSSNNVLCLFHCFTVHFYS